MITAFILITFFLVLAAAGPRARFTGRVTLASIPSEARELPDYLAESERTFVDIIPGAEKLVEWAGTPGERTEFALVYLHGFSACRQELAPVPANLARELGANAYHARLSGHGRKSPDALAGVKADDWGVDAAEAAAIGRLLGDRIILLGSSTGATLAILEYLRNPDSIAALLLLSPNFGTKAGFERPFLLPWGWLIARMRMGKYHSWDPENAGAASFWANPFRTSSLPQVAATVKACVAADLRAVDCPVLGLYAGQDETLDTGKIEEAFGRIGSESAVLRCLDDADKHVMAGDILSPHMTEPVTRILTDFTLENTGAAKP